MRWRDIKQKKNHSKPIESATNSTRVNHAGIADRIKAFITDMFMIYIPILYIITYGIMSGKDEFQGSEFGPLIGVLLYAIIDALFTYKTGQTPGKKAYDIQVVDFETEQKLSFLRALWRFIVFLACAATVFALLVPFFRKDRRALHDLITKTVLIKRTA